MESFERVPSPNDLRGAFLVAVLASIGYTGVVFWYTVQPSSNVSISGTLWHSVALYSVFAFGTIGVPLLLRLRYEIRGPAVLLAGILLFWHVLIPVPSLPPFGSGGGDAPAWTFVFVFVPVYLVAYGLLAGGEYWLRSRSGSASEAAG